MANRRQIEGLVPEQLRGMRPMHGAREAMKQIELRRFLNGIRQRCETGAILEFGVGSGATLANLVDFVEGWRMPNMSYGFDSFMGLPKDEGQWRKGWFAFPREHAEKAFEGLSNYQLVEGWFEDTLTPKLREQLQIKNASMILVDSDLYSSAVTVLEWVKPLILPGTYIVFDEWGHGEDQAWKEFVQDTTICVEEIPTGVGEQYILRATSM